MTPSPHTAGRALSQGLSSYPAPMSHTWPFLSPELGSSPIKGKDFTQSLDWAKALSLKVPLGPQPPTKKHFMAAHPHQPHFCACVHVCACVCIDLCTWQKSFICLGSFGWVTAVEPAVRRAGSQENVSPKPESSEAQGGLPGRWVEGVWVRDEVGPAGREMAYPIVMAVGLARGILASSVVSAKPQGDRLSLNRPR